MPFDALNELRSNKLDQTCKADSTKHTKKTKKLSIVERKKLNNNVSSGHCTIAKRIQTHFECVHHFGVWRCKMHTIDLSIYIIVKVSST